MKPLIAFEFVPLGRDEGKCNQSLISGWASSPSPGTPYLLLHTVPSNSKEAATCQKTEKHIREVLDLDIFDLVPLGTDTVPAAYGPRSGPNPWCPVERGGTRQKMPPSGLTRR
eukprot:gene26121-biopygen14172